MTSRTAPLGRTALGALALAAPALFAAHLVGAAGDPGARLEQGLPPAAPLLAQAGGEPAPALPARASTTAANEAIGMLYTRGRATVLWNGASVEVEDGSYAYVGGEEIRMSPGAIGLLLLADGSTVYVCPGSRVRVRRGDGDAYALDVRGGGSRFAFRDGSAFRVRAGQAEVAADGAPGSGRVGEVWVRPDGGCLVCELTGALAVSAPGTAAAPSAGRARVVDVAAPSPGSGDGYRVGVTPVPDPVRATLAAAADGRDRYLCRCERLWRDAEGRDPARLADVPPQPEPPVAPPPSPPVALAEPGPPDPFDPGILPAPEPGEPVAPVIVVVPPAVPASGFGGGSVASPS